MNLRLSAILLVFIAQFWSLNAAFGAYEDLSPAEKALKDYEIAQYYTDTPMQVYMGETLDLGIYGASVVAANDLLNLASLDFLDSYAKDIVATASTKPEYKEQLISVGNLGRLRQLINNEAAYELDEIDWNFVYKMFDKALADCNMLDSSNLHCQPKFLKELGYDLQAFAQNQEKFARFEQLATFADLLSI